MIYTQSQYKNYKYLVEVSDNYVVLTDSHYANGDWQNPDTIDIIYQFINEPLTVIEAERDITTTRTFQQVDISHNFFDSPKYPQYSTNIIIVVMFILYIINPITKMVKKGGIFFGS